MTSAYRAILALCLVLTLGACGLSTSDMVPESVAVNTKHIDASVTIMDVTGDRETNFGGAIFITNADFKEALRKTLTEAKIFRSIQDNGGDLLLFGKVKQQDQDVQHVLEYRANITVEYLFRQSSDQKIVWDETYASEFSSTAFSGATRTIVAREGAIRENLAAFLKGISESWP